MVDRIKKLMEAKKLSATQFSESIGVQRSSLSHVLSGRNKPSLDFMLKIKETFSEINLDWLLLGEGEMISGKTDKEENNDSSEKKNQEFELDFSSASQPGEQKLKEQTESEGMGETTGLNIFSTGTRVLILYEDQTYEVFRSRK